MLSAKEVNNYSVTIYTDPGQSRGAEIWFKDKDNRSAGRIYFVESEKESGKNFVDRGGNPVVHLPFSMFEAVMNVIRNEKPLYFGDRGLSTSSEPIGEAE